MELILSDEDARTLRDLLSNHLRDLRLEVARTEAKDFRHVMLLRQESSSACSRNSNERRRRLRRHCPRINRPEGVKHILS
jgi:hypothetical protein